ncbi:MltR family transcriptional regulator [Zobellella denitrificans]|jgi:mannitol operon repressor|uniref:MltR family transcriptional regulator n=1 Tax=Zobellella denitrificans TaxID=347534 RepID=UPI000B8C6608|nr:MltR family transcriptional regulator [Zobellella denitrificans]OXS16699.1 MltR family transcriptional regulator [Zobellella denitrificans]
MISREQEAEIFERLHRSPSARGFVIAMVEVFDDMLDQLIQKVFRKDDYAVKFAVEPLLGTMGPLADLAVRLKLVYGLGIISQQLYQDIDRLIKLRDYLNSQGHEYRLADPEIAEPLKALHMVAAMEVQPFTAPPPAGELDPGLLQMQQQRQEQVIRSALALAVVAACADMTRANPLLAG